MTTSTTDIIAVWAESDSPQGDLIIGNSATNDLPWPHDSEDMKHFREVTRDRVLVMGRNTFRSLPEALKTRRATLERPMIVFTTWANFDKAVKETSWSADASSDIQPIPVDHIGFNAAQDVVDCAHEWFPGKGLAVIGGTRVIEFMGDVLDKLIVTTIHGKFEGDVVAPGEAFVEERFEALRSVQLLDNGNRVHTYLRKASA